MLFMAAVPLLCWLGPLRALTVAIFEINSSWGAFWCMVIVMTATGGIVTSAESYAVSFRFRYPGSWKVAQKAVAVWRWVGIGVVAANAIWIWKVSTYERSALELPIGSGIIFGLCICVCVTGGPWTNLRMLRPVMNPIRARWPRFAAWLAQRGIIGTKVGNMAGLADALHLLRARGRRLSGILARTGPGESPVFVDGIGQLMIYAILLVVMFGVVENIERLQGWLPPIVSLYFLIAVLSFVLSALTFVFDRHRLPLLTLLVAYLGFMSLWPETDHFYGVQPRSRLSQKQPLVTYLANDGKSKQLSGPAQVLGKAGAGAKGHPVVVITMAGGGIQAAAWPLVALDRLERQVPDFHNSVVLLSGVSGGSVGAMYYTGAYQNDHTHLTGTAADCGLWSSLSPIMVAAVRDELIKAALPIEFLRGGRSVLRDRGFALEQSLRYIACKHEMHPLAEATLDNWGVDTWKGIRPALIMNGTVVETGERMAFSTVPCEIDSPGAVEFSRRYNADIGIETAARLSATFPFVSPAARPAVIDSPVRIGGAYPKTDISPGAENRGVFPQGGSYHHVVDGGYFEGSGMVGAITWLNEACEQLSEIAANDDAAKTYRLPTNLILLQMSGFPERPASENRAVDQGEHSHGTLFDIVAPIEAVVGIRVSVQAAFSKGTVGLFMRRWANSPSARHMTVTHLTVKPVLSESQWNLSQAANIGYLAQNPPLSWHLRECERNAINEQLDKSADCRENDPGYAFSVSHAANVINRIRNGKASEDN